MTEPVHTGNKLPYSASLPAKITGIVFWGMVLIGVLVAAYLLNEREQRLQNTYNSAASFVEFELERTYRVLAPHLYDEAYMRQQLTALYNEISNDLPVCGLHLAFAGQSFRLGGDIENKVAVGGVFSVRGNNDVEPKAVHFDLYLQDIDEMILQDRKNMLMVIGMLVFSFGMILQQILQRVLSRPILAMVASVQQFAEGDLSARFNENRNDELGYLAKFINQALDSILQQQQELELSRKALIKEKIQAEVTLHSIMDGVITIDAEGLIVYLNPVAERMLGLEARCAEDMPLQDVIQLVHEDSGEDIISPTVACLVNRRVEVLENHAALLRADGKVIPIEATAAPMRNDEGEIIGAVMVFQDVSQQRRMSRQLSYQASHDMLTGLYNRHMFEEQLETVLLNVLSENRQHALCYVDLDQFKIVNDTCGHVAGDELLRQLAELFKSCIREGDILARLGGDEFGLLLENCELKQAAQVAEKLRQSVKNYRFVWQDNIFEIGVSIGVAGINADNTDLSQILAAADMACFAAKDMGRNRVHIYEPSDAVLAERHGQMHWAGRITRALDEDRFVLFKQPVVALSKQADADHTSHCEVLVRMRDNDAIINPGAFIPAAERYNLMPDIDRWVVTQVFEMLQSSDRAQVVAINLSGASLVDDSLLRYVLEAAEKYQVELSQVCFEITETAAIGNLRKAMKFIKELRARGCRFSLDDFGSGLSSFSYLKNLSVDYLKIDGAFVVDMLNDPVDRAMVEAIVSVGHIMGIKVIAEWVENQQTLELLREMGVDYAQGFYLGRPEEIQQLESA